MMMMSCHPVSGDGGGHSLLLYKRRGGFHCLFARRLLFLLCLSVSLNHDKQERIHAERVGQFHEHPSQFQRNQVSYESMKSCTNITTTKIVKEVSQ